MLNRLGLTFAVLLVASSALAQSGTRNIMPPPSGGSGTRNVIPNSAQPSVGSGTRNTVPYSAPSQSFSTPQPPFSQLPSEFPPFSSQGQIQSSPCGPGGCSVAQPQYAPYSYSPQPSFRSAPYYSSGFGGGGCSSQSSYAPRVSYYSGSYYQPRQEPRYRSSYRGSCR